MAQSIGKQWATALVEATKIQDKGAQLSILLLGKSDTNISHLASALNEKQQLKRLYCCSVDNDQEVLTEVAAESEMVKLMQQSNLDLVLAKTEKIAVNGDLLVEHGMLIYCIAAQYYNLPIYVVAATSTVQLGVPTAKEFDQKTQEIIPASLIDGFVTEKGIVHRSGNEYDLRSFIDHGYDTAPASSKFSKFVHLDEDTVVQYLKTHSNLAEKIGSVDAEWKSREAGDGNINYVFIVEGPLGGLVVKQALPYIRVVGENWPLTTDRVRIEAKWLMELYKICPEHVPLVHCFDPTLSVIVMQYFAPPFETLRLGILAGRIFPCMAEHISRFLAQSLFFTSAFALKADAYRRKIAEYNNPELCLATEQVIFMDAYYDAPTNAYLKPELENIAAEIRNDLQAKIAISRLRRLFMSSPQALLHGDFHTGSVMVTKESTIVFDSEFAFYGPMAFDIGKFIGNLFLAYFALDGHATDDQPRTDQQQWLIDSAIEIWEGFKSGFLNLWNVYKGKGDAYPSALVEEPRETFAALQDDFMQGLFGEVLGFAAACMIRRIVTIAQIEDYRSIEDRNIRAACSTRALNLARRLLIDGDKNEHFPDMRSVVELAKEIRLI